MTSPGPGGGFFGRIGHFLRQNATEIVRDLAIALLALGITFYLDGRIAERQLNAEECRARQQEVLENVRFLRERSGDPSSYKPFTRLELTAANLSGLMLGCESRGRPSCAVLNDATLTQAGLEGTGLAYASLERAVLNRAALQGADLRGANLHGADLSGANYEEADLHGADLTDSDLTAANLRGANLAGANLSNADVRGAFSVNVLVERGLDCPGLNFGETHTEAREPTFAMICYDDKTRWPYQFRPPAGPRCDAWPK